MRRIEDREVPARIRSLANNPLALPLAVWAGWRLAHLLAVLAWGGDPVGDTFRFDGAWMRSILEQGYVRSDPTYSVQQNLPFLPGMIWLTKPLALLIGNRWGAFVMANVAGLVAFGAVHAAIAAIAGPRAAGRAVVALALWPGSLVLWAYMSEAPLVAATALAVLADVHRRPGRAGLAAFVAGTCRVVGFTVGPALAVARVVRLRRVDAVACGYALTGVAGFGAVALAQHLAVGDGLAFARAQNAWDRSIAPPGSGVLRGVREIVVDLPALHLETAMNITAAVLAFAALLVATDRFGLGGRTGTALVAGWVGLIVALSSELVASQIRYVLAAWAGLLVLAPTGAPRTRRQTLLEGALVVVAVGVSLVLSRRWVNDAFVA